MSFGQELKDFIAGYKAGRDMFPGKYEREKREREARREALQIEGQELANKYSQLQLEHAPETFALDIEGKRANLDATRANTAFTRKRAAGYDQELAMRREDNAQKRSWYNLRQQELQGKLREQEEKRNAITPEDEFVNRLRVNPAGGVDEEIEGEIGPRHGSEDQPDDADYLASAPEKAHTFVKDGMQSAISASGMDQDVAIPDQNTQAAARGYLAGKGAADPKDVKEVRKVVGETIYDKVRNFLKESNPKISDSELTMMTFHEVGNFFLQRGQMDQYQNAMASLWQFYRMQAQQHMSLAKAVAGEGDLKKALSMMEDAYSLVPDGRDIHFKTNKNGSIEVSYTDTFSGDELPLKFVASPKEVLAGIMNMDASFVEEAVMTAAGIRAEKEKGVSPKDMVEFDSHIKESFDAYKEANGGQIPGLSPSEERSLLGWASKVFAQSTDITPDQAVDAGIAILNVDPANPEARSFDTVTNKDGSVTAIFANGLRVTMKSEAAMQIAKLRKDRVDRARKQYEEDQKRANQPGFMGRVSNIMEQAGLNTAIPAEHTSPAGAMVNSDPALQNLLRQKQALEQAGDYMKAKAVEHQINMRLQALNAQSSMPR